MRRPVSPPAVLGREGRGAASNRPRPARTPSFEEDARVGAAMLRLLLLAVLLGFSMTAVSAGVAGAQTPAPSPVAGPIYVVTYVEVMPTAAATAAAVLRAYRDAARREDGNLRCEILERIGQPNQLVA